MKKVVACAKDNSLWMYVGAAFTVLILFVFK